MASAIQNIFFESIRKNLPQNLSLAEALSDALGISSDSAYRRIRGDTMLSLEEIQALSNYFKISVDQVLSLNSNTTTFSGNFIDGAKFSLEHYLQGMIDELMYVNSFDSKEMIYFAQDVPIFHYLMFPELAAFKFFIWIKTLLPEQPGNESDNSFEAILEVLLPKSKKLTQLYAGIPGVEILSPEITATTQWQIEYFRDAKFYRNEKEITVLYDKLDEMIYHMERQAEEGKKFLPGTKVLAESAPYKLYINDFVIGDNTVLSKTDESYICYINHNTINFFSTKNVSFIDYTARFLDNVIRKSILISSVGEKERSIFFNNTHRNINKCRQNFIKSAGAIDY